MHHFSTGLIIQYRGKTHKHVKTTCLYKVQEERSICRIDIFYFILSGIREEQVLPGAREPHAALAHSFVYVYAYAGSTSSHWRQQCFVLPHHPQSVFRKSYPKYVSSEHPTLTP